jgi:hypothetical protein
LWLVLQKPFNSLHHLWGKAIHHLYSLQVVFALVKAGSAKDSRADILVLNCPGKGELGLGAVKLAGKSGKTLEHGA